MENGVEAGNPLAAKNWRHTMAPEQLSSALDEGVHNTLTLSLTLDLPVHVHAVSQIQGVSSGWDGKL